MDVVAKLLQAWRGDATHQLTVRLGCDVQQGHDIGVHFMLAFHRRTKQLLSHELVEWVVEQGIKFHRARYDLTIRMFQVRTVDLLEAVGLAGPVAWTCSVYSFGVLPLARQDLDPPVAADGIGSRSPGW